MTHVIVFRDSDDNRSMEHPYDVSFSTLFCKQAIILFCYFLLFGPSCL